MSQGGGGALVKHTLPIKKFSLSPNLDNQLSRLGDSVVSLSFSAKIIFGNIFGACIVVVVPR